LPAQGALETLLLNTVMPQTPSLVLRVLLGCCVTTVFERGNQRSLSTRYAQLFEAFTHKEQAPRLGALSVFTALALRFGNAFVENMTDLANVWGKAVKAKDKNEATREAVCLAVAAVYKSTGGPMRGTGAAEAFLKVLTKCAGDKSDVVRCAAAQAMLVVVESVGEITAELDAVLPCLLKALKTDALDAPTRRIVAVSLGLVLVSAQSKDRRNAKAKAKSKLPGMSTKEHYDIASLDDAFQVLERPFVKATSALNRAGLALAMTTLLQAAHLTPDTAPKYVAMVLGVMTQAKGLATDKLHCLTASCLERVCREGIIAGQSEQGVSAMCRTVVELLQAQAKRPAAEAAASEPTILVCLDLLKYTLVRLGLVVESLEVKDRVLEALLHLLATSSAVVRTHAAQCIRQLALAAPSQQSTWLSVLHAIVKINLSELTNEHTDLAPAVFCSLHGHLSALAALVSVVPDNADGVPIALLDDVFHHAQQLLSVPCGSADSAAFARRRALQEAAWVLIGALLSLGKIWVAPRVTALFSQWKHALVTKPPAGLQGAQLCAELTYRTRALAALRAYVSVHRRKMTEACDKDKGQSASQQVRNTVAFLSVSSKLLRDKERLRHPDLVGAAQGLTAVLLDIYVALPPHAYVSSWKGLLQLAVGGFTGSFSEPTTDPCNELGRLLSPGDGPLEGLEDSDQRAFARVCETATKNNGHSWPDHTWVWGRRVDPYDHHLTPPSPPGGELEPEHALYRFRSHAESNEIWPQDADEVWSAPGYRCADACVRLFAAIFLHQPPHTQEQLVKHFADNVANAKNVPAIQHNWASALLAVCREAYRLDVPLGEGTNTAVRDGVLRVCATLLLDAPSASARRACGESLGILCRVEGEAFVNSVITCVKGAIGQSAAPLLRAGAAFALGCIHRYVGGLRTIKYHAFTIAALQQMGKDADATVHTWVLHSLWLAVEAGGLSFSSYVQPTLALVTGALLRDHTQRGPGCSAALARVVAAVARALGPELKEPSTHAYEFLDIWRGLARPAGDLPPAVVVEILRTLQQLLLWRCPLDLSEWRGQLGSHLSSPLPAVRRAALYCMRAWAEQEPAVVLEQGWDILLLAQVERERGFDGLRALVQHTFEACVDALLPRGPQSGADAGEESVQGWTVTWRVLDTCKRCLTQNRLPSDTTFGKVVHRDVGEGGGKGEDDDEVITIEQRGADKGEEPTGPTKVFALECMEGILLKVQARGSPHHWDAAYARKTCPKKPTYLVQQMNDLVTVVCMAMGADYTPLRVAGLRALQTLLRVFADTMDTDGDGDQVLLELYQAQITSALRQALAGGGSDGAALCVAVRCAACEAAVVFSQSGVLTDDVALSRLLRILTGPVLDQGADLQRAVAAIYGPKALSQLMLAHVVAVAKLDLVSVDAKVFSHLIHVIVNFPIPYSSPMLYLLYTHIVRP
jgi:hypothetical protein